MVEHQRRLHQQGTSPNDVLHDCSSDAKEDEPPSTPQHYAITWPPLDIVSKDQEIPHGPLHPAITYADLHQQAHDQHMPQQYSNQYGIPSNLPQDFHGQPIPNYYVSTSTPHRTTTLPRQIYHVTERSNPGIITMTNAATPHHQLPQQVERPPIELPYSTLPIEACIRSSHRTFSAMPVSSHMAQECFDTNLLGKQPEYAQADSRLSIIQRQELMQYLMSQFQQPVASQAQPVHAPAASHSHQKSVQAQQEQCSNYDLPIEVRTIGQLQTYGTAVYNPYGAEIEVGDPSMQLPSSRLTSPCLISRLWRRFMYYDDYLIWLWLPPHVVPI
jgi:hypothetical protein